VARVGEMRAGYGYNGIPDPNRAIAAPADSGVWKINLDTGETQLLFSLADIAREFPLKNPDKAKHYINHIQWSPDGARFLFLNRGSGVGTRMFTAAADGTDRRLVHLGSSHYTWRDPKTILIWADNYVLVNDDGSLKSEVLWSAPNGHESYLPGNEWIITDTYPIGPNREQCVYLYHVPTANMVPVGFFPVPKGYDGEWRCDTHPRLSRDGTKVCIDSTHEGNGRQLYLIDIKDILRKPREARPNARIEAESAEPTTGLSVDRRKAAVTSGGAVLGVHCDSQPHVTGRWTFRTRDNLPKADLLVRFAGLKQSRFAVSVDHRPLGQFGLPEGGGWGSRDEEWQIGRVPLAANLPRGEHLLEIVALDGAEPVNLDWLEFVAADVNPIKTLEFVRNDSPPITQPIDLPEWSPPAQSGSSESFVLDPEKNTMLIWGRGRGRPTHYFQEFLPGLFERTLELDQLDLDEGTLEWVFTGDDGGVTVTLADSHLVVTERIHGAPGLGDIEGAKQTRHVEYVTHAHHFRLKGRPQAVSVAMDHRLQWRVAVNGKEVLAKTFEIDLTRHQLALTAAKGRVAGRCLTPTTISRDVTVDPTGRHQTIVGFGGITTPTAYVQLSPEGKRRWWELVVENNLLIQREYPIGTQLNRQADNWERLADATPHYYGDNFPNGEICNFDYNRTIRGLGGQVWFEFWVLPPWARREWRAPDGRSHRNAVDVDRYVEAMLAYCRASQERAGAPPDVVGIQNETQQPIPLWYEMTLALRKGLDEAGFDEVRIHMSDASNLRRGIAWLADLRRSPEAWAKTDYVAAHMYDYQDYFTDPDAFDPRLTEWNELADGKPFLSTELCVNSRDYQWKSYRLALSMGQLYHKNLVLADAAALCYCWGLLNVVQPPYGWTRSLFVPDAANGFLPKPSSHQLRVFAAFSRRLPAGMVRVDADSGDPDVLASAYVGPAGEKTLILLNRSTSPREIRVQWPGAEFTEAELVDPYHANHRLPAARLVSPVSHTVPPGGIVTLTNLPRKELPADFVIFGDAAAR